MTEKCYFERAKWLRNYEQILHLTSFGSEWQYTFYSVILRSGATKNLQADSSPHFVRLRMTVHFIPCHSEERSDEELSFWRNTDTVGMTEESTTLKVIKVSNNNAWPSRLRFDSLPIRQRRERNDWEMLFWRIPTCRETEKCYSEGAKWLRNYE
jgi:hypothetical protein